MHRLMLSLGFGSLLVLSIVIKAQQRWRQHVSDLFGLDEDIAALLLRKNGFAIPQRRPEYRSSMDVRERDDCRLQIANVSPRLARATVEWQAADRSCCIPWKESSTAGNRSCGR